MDYLHINTESRNVAVDYFVVRSVLDMGISEIGWNKKPSMVRSLR